MTHQRRSTAGRGSPKAALTPVVLVRRRSPVARIGILLRRRSSGRRSSQLGWVTRMLLGWVLAVVRVVGLLPVVLVLYRLTWRIFSLRRLAVVGIHLAQRLCFLSR